MGKSPLLYALLPFAWMFVTMNFGIVSERNSAVQVREYSALPDDDLKCVDCHSDLIESSVVHSPASESCANCHQVDMKEHTENKARGLNLVQEVPDLCFKCHDDLKKEVESTKNVHQALNIENRCTNCHSPHSSDEKKLLVTEQQKLCLSCHNKDVTSDGKKAINMKRLLTESKVIHPPVKSGKCTTCHQPHASSENYLLISAFPSGQYAKPSYENFAICWECHDSDLLEVEKTTSATNFRDGDRNLHFVHMNGEKGRSCIMCHNVHAANNEHLIEDNVSFGEWELPVKYKPTDSGGSCFPGCHAEKTYNNQ